MEPVAYVAVGLMAGLLAHVLFGSRGGLLSNVLAGVVGAVAIAFALARLKWSFLPDFSGYLVKAVLGAVVSVTIWRSFFKA